jgi:hypothetical protein
MAGGVTRYGSCHLTIPASIIIAINGLCRFQRTPRLNYSPTWAACDKSEMQLVRGHLKTPAIDDIHPMPLRLSQMLLHNENCKGIFSAGVFNTQVHSEAQGRLDETQELNRSLSVPGTTE